MARTCKGRLDPNLSRTSVGHILCPRSCPWCNYTLANQPPSNQLLQHTPAHAHLPPPLPLLFSQALYETHTRVPFAPPTECRRSSLCYDLQKRHAGVCCWGCEIALAFFGGLSCASIPVTNAFRPSGHHQGNQSSSLCYDLQHPAGIGLGSLPCLCPGLLALLPAPC